MKIMNIGMVFLIKSMKDVLLCSVIIARQIWVGEICIAIYVILIKSTNKATPPSGMVAKASGIPRAIMAWDPATIVPIKNMAAKIAEGGIGNTLK